MPTVSAIPAVIDALVAQADAALTSVTVYDGFGISDDPGDFLMVGVDDADLLDAATSAESSQVPATMGTLRTRQETGTVTCLALSWNGDADMAAARTAAFATANEVSDLIRADPSLGLGAPDFRLLVAGYGGSERLMQNQDEDGAEAALVFTVTFTAQI